MIARVVENWLTRTTEREYQFPFCQALISKGFRVLHVSSHGPQEEGKDIIAMTPDGRPAAFQLKTGNINVAYFRKILPQLRELVEIPIQYPGIPADGKHRCFLVTNGTIADTVQGRIEGLNRKWAVRGEPALEVIGKGDLLRDFVDLHGAYFPVELGQLNELLKLYLYDGSAPLPRGKFAKFILANMPIGDLSSRERRVGVGSKQQVGKGESAAAARHLASTLLLGSYGLRSFAEKRNFWAVFEGWVILAAHILAVAERLEMAEQWWTESFELCSLAARSALEALIEESLGRANLLEGDVLVDSAVYRARVTVLVGLMAGYDLICRLRNVENRHGEGMARFITEHKARVLLWGESGIPYLVFLGWYLENNGDPRGAEGLWGAVIRTIVTSNKRGGNQTAGESTLADPYLECEKALERAIGVSEEYPSERITYGGQSYTLRSLVLLLARRWRRRLLASIWYDITDVNFVEMFPRPAWGFLLWRFPKGDLRIMPPGRPQSWAALIRAAEESDGADLPQRLLARPDFLTAFLCVYPHRLRADAVALLDGRL